jgi:metal-sulfur cluster biosynthetic enzyme
MMDLEMKNKIDAVLDRVKDPESNLSIAQMGLVEKLRYLEKQRMLIVFTKQPSAPKACCTIIAKMLQTTIAERLTLEFKKEFPDLTIEFA